MITESFTQAQWVFLGSGFVIALIMGAAVNATNFCTMGAVSDWINIGDSGRLRAWLLAVAVAVLGVALLEAGGLVRPDESFPPYRGAQLIWAENLLGGLMFGAGMTLASGCGAKTLIRIGGGNLKSVVVFAIIAPIAFYMVNPFPNSDKTLFTVMFYGWLRPLAVQLPARQDLGALLASPQWAFAARLSLGLILGGGLLALIFGAKEFRRDIRNIIGGAAVGLAVLAAWWVTSNVGVRAEGQVFSLQNFVADQWDFFAAPTDVKPAATRPLAPQSFTFINPIGQSLGLALSGFGLGFLTFGVMSTLGMIAGSFLWSILTGRFRIEWFVSFDDFLNHVVGAVLMGLGGVLAVGCTIGQAVTGVSTLALGSMIAFAGIFAGAAGMMKYQYWRILREA